MGGNRDLKAGLAVGQQNVNVLLDQLMVAAGNGAKPLVARAGLQRESRNGSQQAVEGKGVIIAQDIERFLLNLRQKVVELNQSLSVAGEDRAAAAFAAGRPVNQGLLAELIISLIASQALYS